MLSAEHFFNHAPRPADAADTVGNINLIGIGKRVVAANDFYAIGVFSAGKVIATFHEGVFVNITIDGLGAVGIESFDRGVITAIGSALDNVFSNAGFGLGAPLNGNRFSVGLGGQVFKRRLRRKKCPDGKEHGK